MSRPKNFTAEMLIDKLMFSSDTIQDKLDELTLNMDESELTIEDTKKINDVIFQCESCTSWLPMIEKSKSFTSAKICVDCSTLEEGENNDDE